MGLSFPTNLLTSGNSKTSLSKILDFSKPEVEDEESEFGSSGKKKKKNICSTFSIVLVWVVLRLKFCLCPGKSIKGFLDLKEEVGFSIFSSIRSSCWPIICKKIINKIGLFNNLFCFNRNRGVNINYFSNFERGGLYLHPFTINNNCIKGRMAGSNNNFIFLNKI